MSRDLSLNMGRDDRAKTVAVRWREQYFYAGKWGSTIHGPSEETYKQLLAADGNADKIDAVFGDGLNSWTAEMCCCCNEYRNPTVQFNSDPESWSDVCLDCAKAAVKLMTRKAKP